MSQSQEIKLQKNVINSCEYIYISKKCCTTVCILFIK